MLRKKIENRIARAGVIGLGYVGLPLAVSIARAGFQVTGIDVDTNKVEAINRGISYIEDIDSEELTTFVSSGRIAATTDYAVLAELDTIDICVPTPLGKSKEPDMSYIISAVEQIARYIRANQLIILESTTYPGTTEEIVMSKLEEESGLKVGRDFFLAFSPERIDPGNEIYTLSNTPKIVGGITPKCTEIAKTFYQQFISKVVPVSSTRAAEMVKLLENTFRSVNIGLVNEMALMCDKMGLDVWEIVEAAATKPYGFMPFYPGPGLGGHCLSENEILFVKNGDGLSPFPLNKGGQGVVPKGGRGVVCVRIGDYFTDLERQYPEAVRKVAGVTLIEPEGINTGHWGDGEIGRWSTGGKAPKLQSSKAPILLLSFDLEKQETCYKPLQALSRREYHGVMIDIVTVDGRSLRVTDGHPMVIWANHAPHIKRAADLQAGDELIVPTLWPEGTVEKQEIDLIAHLTADEIAKTRVAPKGGCFKDYRDQLTPHLKTLRVGYHEIYRRNRMPLSTYLELERSGTMPFSRRDIMLRTGRGASWSTIPAVVAIDNDFARLVGYYLSEGCITKNKSLHTRFVFNSNEHEYINDVCDILTSLGLRYSKHKDKVWNALQIKVSSNLFARMIRDILGCGTRSTDMQIPGVLLAGPEAIRLSVLSGLLRGDGGVDLTQKTRHYYHNKKQQFYNHYIDAATIGYFSSSPFLFQQTVALAQGLGFVPTFKKNKPYLRLYGQPQLARLLPLFDGAKRAKLHSYINNRRKQMPTKSFTMYDNFATVRVRQVSRLDGTHIVYSAEVEGTHTFVTSYGIVTHNCIPVDPHYLSWKAKSFEFYARFIELASEINSSMPHHVLKKITDALNSHKKCINGAKLLILGVAYKKNVGDTRESPALDIIEMLAERGGDILYSDPYVPEIQTDGHNWKSLELTDSLLKQADCAIIITNHSCFDYQRIVEHAQLVVDARNATADVQFGREKIVKI